VSNDIFAEPEHVDRVEDCSFYHVMEIPEYGVVGAERLSDEDPVNRWDLRGGVDNYLGHVQFADKRVLEIGPASGFLTFSMEARGAAVVAVEIGPDSTWDIVPHGLIDRDAVNAGRQKALARLRRGFWFVHERLGSRAQVFYGNGRSLPDELGRFDIALLASVLTHNRDPLNMIEQCARLADCIIIVERHFPDLGRGPIAQLYASARSPQWDTWWNFSPGLFAEFLEILGFEQPKVMLHSQTHVHPGGSVRMPMFTVVGHRP
jgi:O-methyltransferase